MKGTVVAQYLEACLNSIYLLNTMSSNPRVGTNKFVNISSSAKRRRTRVETRLDWGVDNWHEGMLEGEPKQ